MHCLPLQVDLYSNCFELFAEGDLLIAGTKKKVHVIVLNNVLLIAREQKCGQLEYKAHISVGLCILYIFLCIVWLQTLGMYTISDVCNYSISTNTYVYIYIFSEPERERYWLRKWKPVEFSFSVYRRI